ncbi:hypothetical protein D3C87_996290 [compost metagenome]
MVPAIMYRSPGTSRSASSCCHSPRLRTSSTPSIDSSAPPSARRLTRAPKHSVPTASIHSGRLEPTSVTLIGVEVCSARYWKALYRPMPSRPSSA